MYKIKYKKKQLNNDGGVDVKSEGVDTLNLDEIVATQPELGGPKIPDGGFGWIVFGAVLFFQAMVPSLIASYGIFLSFTNLEHSLETVSERGTTKIWKESMLYTPLFYCIAKITLEPAARKIISNNSSSPRLVSLSSTCLVCSGLLLVWMALMATANRTDLFVLAGCLTGCGATLQLIQCEIIVAQYFRNHLNILQHIMKASQAVGFLFTPIFVGHRILTKNIQYVLFEYQMIHILGLFFCIVLRKPEYLNARNQRPVEESSSYHQIDVRELSQVVRDNAVVSTTDDGPPSGSNIAEEPPGIANGITDNSAPKNWEQFIDEDDNHLDLDEEQEDVKYNKLDDWETFDDVNQETPNNLAEEMKIPKQLYSEIAVNNNTNYSYDEDVVIEGIETPYVFKDSPNTVPRRMMLCTCINYENLLQVNFYRNLLLLITDHFSTFGFYVFYPTFIYLEVERLGMQKMSLVFGTISIATFVFLTFSYSIPVVNRYTPLYIGIFSSIGALSYFMLSFCGHTKSLSVYIVLGAFMVVFSLAGSNHFQSHLKSTNLRGEVSKQYNLLNILSGSSLIVFLLINVDISGVFQIIGGLNLCTGIVWIGYFIYKQTTR